MREKHFKSNISVLWIILFFTFLLGKLKFGGIFDINFEMFVIILCPIVSWIIRRDAHLCKQFLLITCFFLGIWGFGIFNKYAHKNYKLLILLGCICFLLATVITLYGCLKSDRRNISIKWWMFTIVIAYIVLVIPGMLTTPEGDSFQYYSITDKGLIYNFDFTFNNIRDFNFFGHISIGYALICLFGESIYPYTGVALRLVHVFLILYSGFKLRKVFKVYITGLSEKSYIICMLIYLVSPFILGKFGGFDLDYAASFILVILVSCHLLEQRILEVFFSFVFVFMKEPNAAYYCFFILAIFCIDLIKKEKEVKFFEFVRKELIKVWYMILIFIYWIYALFSVGGWGKMLIDSIAKICSKTTPLTTNAESVSSVAKDVNNVVDTTVSAADVAPTYHKIGFTWDNFWVRFKQIFITNFNWLMLVVIVAIIIFILFKYRKNVDFDRFVIPIIFFSITIGVLFVNTIYLDFYHYRYIGVGNMSFMLTGLSLVTAVVSSRKINRILIPFLAIILIQSFITIDPMMMLVFPSYGEKYGNSTIRGASKDTLNSDYNREYYYTVKIIDKVMKEVDLSENDLFVYNDVNWSFGADGMQFWDKKAKRRVLTANDNTFIINGYIPDVSRVPQGKKYDEGYDRIIEVYPYTAELDEYDYQVVSYATVKVKYYIR